MSTGSEIATVRIPEVSNTIGGINIRFGEFTVELQNGCDPQRVFEVLRMLKAGTFELDPFQGAIFVFCNKDKNKIKVLHWDKDGFTLYYSND
ncbi:transposase [Anoxybacterium hadale]|uniref:Transposase n=1 Tax=Anoxybacterium hadale TaxID=3408580 RepID=A0ACD1AGQ4_9FIRM|nr:transposase [Clostridiales bacterium]